MLNIVTSMSSLILIPSTVMFYFFLFKSSPFLKYRVKIHLHCNRQRYLITLKFPSTIDYFIILISSYARILIPTLDPCLLHHFWISITQIECSQLGSYSTNEWNSLFEWNWFEFVGQKLNLIEVHLFNLDNL